MTTPRPVLQALWSLHRGIYAVSGGRLGTTPAGPGDRLGMLFLMARGRTTGQLRRTALYYLDDGRNLAVVASNAGLDRDPSWWRNLQAMPRAEVVSGMRPPVGGREDRDRHRTGAALAAVRGRLAAVRRVRGSSMTRAVPVEILEPVDPGTGRLGPGGASGPSPNRSGGRRISPVKSLRSGPAATSTGRSGITAASTSRSRAGATHSSQSRLTTTVPAGRVSDAADRRARSSPRSGAP